MIHSRSNLDCRQTSLQFSFSKVDMTVAEFKSTRRRKNKSRSSPRKN